MTISVREAAKALSIGSGQGYIKCNCTGNCATERCSCRSASIAWGSKCHGKQFVCSNNEALYAKRTENTKSDASDPSTSSQSVTKKASLKPIANKRNKYVFPFIFIIIFIFK